MENISSVISKVQKLLRLSENNPSEEEGAAARAAADRIIQEHRLSIADLQAQDETKAEPFARKEVHEGGRRLAWAETILHALCNHYGGCFYLSTGRSGGFRSAGAPGSKGCTTYTVLARESDLSIIEYMYNYLFKEVDRLCKCHCKGAGIKVATAWRNGCANGIASQFRDLKKALHKENTSAALVVLDRRSAEANEELNRQVGGLKTAKGVSGGNDWDARSRGYQEGRKVQINNGLNSNSIMKSLV